MLELLIEMVAQDRSNEITKYCMSKHHHEISASAKCASDLRAQQRKLDNAEYQKHLDDNPHYRYPGMALPNGAIRPLDPCWGQPRVLSTNINKRSC